MTTPFKPVSFTSESITQQKLQQLANNAQWLFENTPRMRYAANGLTRDSGLKIIAGKTAFGTSKLDATDVLVYFGSFFTAGCQPVVTATVQTSGGWLRKFAIVRSLKGLASAIDHTGFVAHVSTHERWVKNHIEAKGWVHWQAIGY